MTKLQLREKGKRQDQYYFPIEIIQVEPGFNGRTDYGDIQALATDILENGLKSPLRVRIDEENPIIVDGERRFKALTYIHENNLGELPRILCILDNQKSTPVTRLFSQLSHNSGKPFTLLEKANLYARIREEASISPAEIARRAQTTKTAVSDALTIHDDASLLILEHLAQKLYSPTCALEIIRTHKDNHTLQDELAEQTLAAAKESGKTKATPRHIPKQKTKDSEVETSSTLTDDNPPPTNTSENQTEEPPNAEQESTLETTTVSTPDTITTGADTSAIDKIKASPSQEAHPFNKGGGGGNGGGGGIGKENVVDARIRRLSELLETVDEDDSLYPDQERRETLDLVADYLDGHHTITKIREHILDHH